MGHELQRPGSAKKYLNLDWKDNRGELMGSTTPREGTDGKPVDYYDLVGSTPYANDYEFDFARELIQEEKLGQGTATDLLVISLSANDVLGHQVGPDSPQMHSMVLALDHQIGDFFQFLSRQFGLAQVWVALSADHGIAPLTEVATRLHIPAEVTSNSELRKELNKSIGARLGKAGDYVRAVSYPIVFLDHEAFPAKMTDAEAEIHVAAALKAAGLRNVFTKEQLAEGEVPPTAVGRMYANSYSPYGGLWVMGQPASVHLARKSGTDHGPPTATISTCRWRSLATVQTRDLSRSGRAHRHGADALGLARHQQAHQLRWPCTHRSSYARQHYGEHAPRRDRAQESILPRPTRST